jgi:hypothetical protein
MDDDEAAGNFPPPDVDEEVADGADPAFGETDDEEHETPHADEPGDE